MTLPGGAQVRLRRDADLVTTGPERMRLHVRVEDRGALIEAHCSACGETISSPAEKVTVMLAAVQEFIERHTSCPFGIEQVVRLTD
jgi:hypothetical protein